jgi:hypothetical protein
VVAAGDNDVLRPVIPVVSDPLGALVVSDTVIGAVPFELPTLKTRLGIETKVDATVVGTVDFPVSTEGVVVTPNGRDDTFGTVAGAVIGSNVE